MIKTISRLLTLSITSLLVIMFVLTPLRPVAALSDADRQSIYDDTVWYKEGDTPEGDTTDPCTLTTNPTAAPSDTSVGTNKDYAGRQILTQGQLDKIKANQPIYEQAANAAGIPWQLLAVIHLRESGLARANPGNGQGVFQFLNKEGGPYPAGPVSDAEFLRQANILALRLKNGYAKSNYPPNRNLQATGNSPELIKDLFFSYNGRASVYANQAAKFGFSATTQGYEGSPYVVNKIDANRDPTVNKTTWGQVKVDHGPIAYPANGDYGAYVTFAALSGVPSGGGGGAGGVPCTNIPTDTSNIRQKIVALAQVELGLWQSGALVPGTGYKKYSHGRSEDWCADFSSWIYNQAGIPLSKSAGGNVPAVSGIQGIGIQTGRYHPAGGYTPQPGDLVIRKNGVSHVNIVISVSGNSMVVIGGNQGGNGSFDRSKVTQYTDRVNNGQISGFVSPE